MATKTKPRKVSIDTLYGFGRDSPEERRCGVRKASAPLEVRQMLDGAWVVRASATRSCGSPRAGWLDGERQQVRCESPERDVSSCNPYSLLRRRDRRQPGQRPMAQWEYPDTDGTGTWCCKDRADDRCCCLVQPVSWMLGGQQQVVDHIRCRSWWVARDGCGVEGDNQQSCRGEVAVPPSDEEVAPEPSCQQPTNRAALGCVR